MLSFETAVAGHLTANTSLSRIKEMGLRNFSDTRVLSPLSAEGVIGATKTNTPILLAYCLKFVNTCSTFLRKRDACAVQLL
jgi:hypothetical protein